MFTLEQMEMRFDEGDEDRYLEIGGGRYLGYEEDGDFYHLWDAPQPMRGKPIQVKAPFGGSVDDVRAFAIDRPPHSVDFVAVGILHRFPDDGPVDVLVSGDIVGDLDCEIKKEKAKVAEKKKNKGMWLLPPFIFRYPKEKPQNLSKNQLLAKISEEALTKLHDECEAIGFRVPSDLDLSIFIDSNSGDEDEQVEAHNIDQQPRTNTWTMEQLNSSLDNCATGNCSHCRGTPPTDVWSMEQLNSSIDNCAMGNCLHCQGY